MRISACNQLKGSLIGAAALLLAGATAGLAQQGGGCSGFKWPIDREETAFAGEGILTVQPGGQIPGIMEAVALKLAPQAQQSFAVPPSHKPHGDNTFAGAFPLVPIAVPGPYQVTISDEAWIDVVQNGKIIKQSGFTTSKDCHAVRKSVRFNLAKGPASVLISDSAKDTIKVDVVTPPPAAAQ